MKQKQHPQILNISCPKCSAPLLAFEQKKPGQTLLHSYGYSIEPTAPIAHAVCPKCGGKAPFDRKLLPP